MENNNLEKVEKEYWGKSFYGSKLNTVLLLVLIVLMIFALCFMYQNQGEYLPSLSKDTVGNTEQKETEINENVVDEDPSFKTNELVVLDSISNFTYIDPVTKKYSDFNDFNVAIYVKYLDPDNSIVKPFCGKNPDYKYLSTCKFVVEKEDGKIEEIAEWPNEFLLKNELENISYINLYEHGSLREFLNIEGSYGEKKNKFYFTTQSNDGCTFSTQEWSFNLDSKVYILEERKDWVDC